MHRSSLPRTARKPMRSAVAIPARLLAMLVLLVGALLLPAPAEAARPAPIAQEPEPGRDDTPIDPLAVAFAHVQQNAPALGLLPDDIADVVVKDNYVTRHNGVTHIVLRQRHAGVEVFNGDIQINIDDSGKVLNLHNNFVPNLAAQVESTTPALSPQQGVEATAAALGLVASEDYIVAQAAEGDNNWIVTNASIAQDPMPVRLVLEKRGGVRLAWEVTIRPLEGDSWWNARTDATTGDLLDKNDLVVSHNWAEIAAEAGHDPELAHDHAHEAAGDHAHEAAGYSLYYGPPTLAEAAARNALAAAGSSPEAAVGAPLAQSVGNASYKVIPFPLEHPNDGSGMPAAHQLVTNPADPTASPFGWHDNNGVAGPEYTDTRGNNVLAQEDADANNSDGARPTEQTAGQLNFGYTYDPALAPTGGTNQAASIVNLFYANNYLHDVLYHYGFDEAAGNFQTRNYSGAGAGNDAVRADAQDGSGTNNANFGTPPDGTPPRMQMFIWTQTSPNRDSGFDNGIIAHEYAHGISNRLVGGPANVSCLWNTEQMGEGWSDFFAYALTVKPGQTGANARGIGTWVLGQPNSGAGIRPWRYSTDMAVNPHTYASISSASVPHGVGSVWAVMLWDLYWAMVNQYGFDADLINGTAGNNMAIRLVVDGLKFTACNPGFEDGRDAILLADQANNGGANFCTIWSVFARRGLGFSADQGSTSSVTDGVQAFDTHPACAGVLYLDKRVDKAQANPGDTLAYTLRVTNYNTQTASSLLLRDTLPAGATYVAGSASDGGTHGSGTLQWPTLNLAPGATITRTLRATVNATMQAQGLLFSDNMENPASGNWNATGLWHSVQSGGPCARAWSPTRAWYFGSDSSCTYNTGSRATGTLTLASPVALPAAPGTTLEFFSWEQTEAFDDFDTRKVFVSTDGVTFAPLYESEIDGPAWQRVRLSLDAWAGQSIYLRFAFDSIDAQFNAYPGWWLDDVRIEHQPVLVNRATLTATLPSGPISQSDTATTFVGNPMPQDELAGAYLITGSPLLDRLNTTGATQSPTDPVVPCVNGYGTSNTVWYAIAPTVPTTATISTADSDYDTVLSVWERASNGTLTNVACDDDSNSTLQSRVTVQLQAGKSYAIQVAEWGASLTAEGQPAPGQPDPGKPAADEDNFSAAGGGELFFFISTVAGPAQPDIAVTPASVSVSVVAGSTATATLTVSNTVAGTTLNLTGSSLAYGSGSGWASATLPGSPISGGAAASVALAFNSAGLAPGTHTATLTLASDDPDEAQTAIPLSLLVLPPPAAPSLGIPANVAAAPNTSVALPISFAPGDATIGSLAFSVDYDQSCLTLPATDSDGDGIPDAIAFSLPAAFAGGALVDLNDGDGEIDITIMDAAPPIATLPAGTPVTLTFNVTCTPQQDQQTAAVAFSADPPPSFGSTTGGNVAGTWQHGSVLVQGTRPGDCNRDGRVDAGDLSACALEIFDGDGTARDGAASGTFAGSPIGCDSNADTLITAGDLVCTVLTIFNGPGSCAAPASSLLPLQPATLALGAATPTETQAGGRVLASVSLRTGGNAIAAALFSLRYDPALLTLDATDADGDGLPDAVAFLGAGGRFVRDVTIDAQQGLVNLYVADLAPPLAALAEGTLLTLAFTPAAGFSPAPDGSTPALRFVDPALWAEVDAGATTASLGDVQGRNVPVTLEQAGTTPPDFDTFIFLPSVNGQ